MRRLAGCLAVAVLFSEDHAADAQACARGGDQCVDGADHALLATKVQLSKLMVAKELGFMEQSPLSVRPQPVPPVSTTMKCVISVTILYFVIWTSLFLVKSVQDYRGSRQIGQRLHNSLVSACDTVAYAPMISILFITTRMRAIAVTNGDTQLYGLPQWWCQEAMVLSTLCVFILTFCSIMENLAPSAAGLLTAVQYLADALLYGGFAVVACGLYSMDTPPTLGKSAPISDTAWCVMSLALFYFLVAILHQVSCTYDLFKSAGQSGNPSSAKAEENPGKFTRVMHHALKALDFAPQICILFLGARMRALQLGHGDPQQWACAFAFAATWGIQAHAVFVAFQQAIGGQNRVLLLLEMLSLMVTHVSTVAVIISVFTIEAVTGPTPFISTTVRVVMSLTVMYFFVHTCLFFSVVIAVDRGWTETQWLKKSVAAETFTACMESIMFVPMMCALFVGTRMRALQISHNKGAPQGWAQDCMMLATWSIFIDLVVVYTEHLFGSPEDKHVVSRCLQATCLGVMHASTSAVILSIFLQTVENTITNGADQLIPGFKIPGRA